MISRLVRGVRQLHRLPEVTRCAGSIRGWAGITSAYLGLTKLPYPARFEMRDGFVLPLESFHDLVTAWILFCRHEYEVPRDAKVVVDFGANYGAFAVLAARAAPHAKIVCFEPFPETFGRLQETIRLNGLEGRVTCLPVAVARQAGSALMNADPSIPSQSRGLGAASTAQATLEVRTLDLAGALEEVRRVTGTRRIDLVKMDIEGAEHAFLPEAMPDTLADIDAWQMEYHPNGPKQALFQALERSSLRLRHDQLDGENGGVAHFARARF
ncbi:MAG: FkbM family methyltransferase [Hyalangium sp.]|uniref:FkbM family methyltransferase n=1 Tax=Hyalangium sp. TaxID=2028555 RepID=UPI00389996B7